MNRILLSLTIFLSFPFWANAQFSKGLVLLGGLLSYAENKYASTGYNNAEQKTSSGNFTISIGKAISENAVFGLNLSYLPVSISNYYGYTTTPLNYKNNGYGIGVFYRLYKSLGKEFYLFGEAGAVYNGSTQSGDSSGNKVLTGSVNGASVYLMPGVAYKISKKFFLELSIPDLFYAGYSTGNTTVQTQTTKLNQFTISTSLSSNPLNAVGIGFRLIL